MALTPQRRRPVMFKKILPLIVLVLIVSCASTPTFTQVNSLKPGITKADFIADFGQPEGTSFQDGYHFLSYFVCEHEHWDPNPCEKYHFAFDKNDRLAAWKAEKSDDVQINGMLIFAPFSGYDK
jgi:hypothetical protein